MKDFSRKVLGQGGGGFLPFLFLFSLFIFYSFSGVRGGEGHKMKFVAGVEEFKMKTLRIRYPSVRW